MLSTKSIGASSSKGGGAASAAAYYEDLATDDYYTAGGEPPGKWIGTGAQNLELTGTVQKGELKATLEGFHPKTGEALAKNAGSEHHGGYDMTFSAPKSVSIAWATADPETQKAITEAQQRAVESAIGKAERDGSFITGRGHAWEQKVAYTDGLVVATFEHGTSREGDPQLHTHAVVSNITPDGRRLDFDTKNKMQLGAAYRAEFAHELKKLGFEIERDKTSFRIGGIDKRLEADFSIRRIQILTELKERGMSGGKAASVAALATREAKGEVNRAQLFEQARSVAKEYGIDPAKIESLRDPSQREERTPEQIESAKMPDHEALANLAVQQSSTISAQQLATAVFQEAQGRMSIVEAETYLEELKQSHSVIELRDNEGNTRYTSREIYDIERRISDRAGVMAKELTHGVRAESISAAMAAKTLSPEQKTALEHVTGPERIALIEGTAGAGKSYMLDAARDAWQRDGYEVRGCALAGKAAEGLEKSSGITSTTIHSTLHQLDSGKLTLDSKTIIVVDEAGMCDSRLMGRLQHHVDQAGAKLVLSGDTRQLQPIDAGGAMRAQREAIGKWAEMNEIRRQKTDEEKAMVHDAKAGRSEKVISYLESNGRLHQYETRDDVIKAMASATIEDLKNGKTSLALAESKAEVHAINQIAREQAKAAGVVQGEDKKFSAERGERQFAPGDRVIFLENSKDLGVKNGTTGTVEKSADGRLKVRLDDTARKGADGKDDLATATRVDIQQDAYNKLDHAYSVTVHKAQGVTVDRAHYAPGRMTHREMAYVALSRMRETVAMYITKDQRESLAQQLAKSQAKGSSSDYSKVEKYQTDIDKAEVRVKIADAEISKLETKIEDARAKISESVNNDNDKQQQNSTTKEQQHERTAPNGRDGRYGHFDAERQSAAQRAIADLRQRDASQAQPSRSETKSIDSVRDVSRLDLVHDKNIGEKQAGGSPKVLLQANERDRVASGSERDNGMRRERAGNREANRGADKDLTKAEMTLGKLEKQLAEAKSARSGAIKDENRARKSQAKAWDKESEAKKSPAPAKEGPKFTPTAKSDPAAAIKRDGDLARKALAAHKAGERLPAGKKLDKAIKSGDLKPTKDSDGRTFFQNTKTGAVLAKNLNLEGRRTTDSKNINHAGLTATKYMVIDKKILGLKYGSTVIKSGGTLKSEAAGKLRESLRAATKGSKLAKIAAKPLDAALKKGERWQKTGALEGIGARVQMKIQDKIQEHSFRRELQAKVQAADQQAVKERAPEKAVTKEAGREAVKEIRKDVERGVQLPPSRAAGAAMQLAARELPAPEREAKAPEKALEHRSFGR